MNERMKMNVKRNATSLNNLECLEKSISTFSSVQDNKFDISNMENSFIFEKSFSFFFFFTPLSLVLKFFSFSGHDRCTSSPPSRIISSCRRNILEEFNAPRGRRGRNQSLNFYEVGNSRNSAADLVPRNKSFLRSF